MLGVFLALFFSAQVIETGRAERRSVTLADGSVLQIDPERLSMRIRLQSTSARAYPSARWPLSSSMIISRSPAGPAMVNGKGLGAADQAA